MSKKIKFIIIFLVIISIYSLSFNIYFITKQSDTHDNLFNIKEITDSRGEKYAPDDGSIGLWQGNGNVNDNLSDYYIVHDTSKYGQLVLNSKINNTFVIKDKIYKIYDIMYVTRDTLFEDIKSKILPGGDTASIQVCVTGSNYYKIVIAKGNG